MPPLDLVQYQAQRAQLPLAVCPNCQYAFVDDGAQGGQFACPRQECGHRWDAGSYTIAAIHGHERRQANPELEVIGGIDPRSLPIPEGESRLGREPACTYQLEHPSVSRQHARVVRQGQRVWIENLSQSVGTAINQQPISSGVLLLPNDTVKLGGVVLRYSLRFAAADVGREYVDNSQLLSRGERSAPLMDGRPVETIALNQHRITFGRALDRTVILPDNMISRKHAVLEYRDGAWFLGDVQSRIGTYVNGQAIILQRLQPGDRIQLGPYLFCFEGNQLRRTRQLAALAVVASNLCQQAGRLRLLDEVSVVFQPGEFVGLLGPSGAGKTTLLDALCGLRPALAGQVLINDEPLYVQYDRLRHLIGYVPQDDIIHRELTCRQALYYAAKLRLPDDLTSAELMQIVLDTLAALDMSERIDVPIGRLSGGQRKRISVGVELLSQPGILFLDEPTSGLDPSTESRLMRKFRELADQGRTVVCTTHVMENIDLFHKVVVLAPGGKLAYIGPPVEAKAYFGIEKFTLLYDKLEEKSPDEWKQTFRQTELHRQQLGPASEPGTSGGGRRRRPAPARISSRLRQWRVLSRRFSRILWADKLNLTLLIAQPLIIAGLICMVCRDLPQIYFLLVISALWFGCSSAAQQIVKERPVYRRERMVNLRLSPYILSKFLILAIITTMQAALMLLLVWIFKQRGGYGLIQFGTLALTAWCGVAMGLVISALASNADKAMSVVPLTLIPQIILAGVLVALPDMNVPTRSVSYVVASRWANQAMEVSLMQGKKIKLDLLKEETNLRPLWNLYPKYELNKDDGRRKFLDENDGSNVDRWAILVASSGMLTSLIVSQLLAVAIILRSQDAF